MKIRATTIIVLVFIAIACGSKSKRSSQSTLDGRTPGWSVMIDEPETEVEPVTTTTDTIPDVVPVYREWKDLDPGIYYGKAPSAQEIAKWKSEFESVNPADSAWYYDLNHYKDMGQYMAVQDLIELLHGPKCENFSADDRRFLWRIDQFDPLVEQKPHSGFEKILFIRGQCERLTDLDYNMGSQWDMTFWAWLSNDVRDLYGRTLEKEILAHASSSISKELKAEFKCEDAYNWATSNAYQKIEGSPEWSGSSFPYRVGRYGIPNVEMGNDAKECFLHALYDASFFTANGHAPITRELISEEYSRFSATFDEDEYSYPLEERREALSEDKSTFFKWMDARRAVSSKLSEATKAVYDNATQAIMRKKLIMLKNRFNIDDFYCEPYVLKHLLGEDCSDEELLSHNLEKLIEDE